MIHSILRSGLPLRLKLSPNGLAIVLALIICAVSPRQARPEEFLNVKAMYFAEENDRVSVFAPAFYFHKDFTPTFGIRIDGIYNAISGATPTGAPPVRRTRTVTTTVPVSGDGGTGSTGGGRGDDDEGDDEDQADSDDSRHRGAGNVHARAGATPAPGGGGGGGGSGGGSRTVTQTIADGPLESPMVDIEDERVGMNLEVVKKVQHHALSTRLSYSTERDYDSIGIALKDGIDFNKRNTVLNIGAAYTHDTIRPSNADFADSKNTIDFIVGVVQTLDAETLLTANVSAGVAEGYLSDPYKVVELNGQLVSETRPDNKSKLTGYLGLTRRLAPLNASIEGSCRLYQDSFDISGNTYSLAWFQELGALFVLRPIIRYHEQTAADFYAVRFTGSPESYSSDYRLSALTAVSYGAKLVWKATENLSFDADYDHYTQAGKESGLPDDVYPTANIFMTGVKISF